MKYLLVLIVLLATIGCAQTQQFPGRLVWEYDYMSVLHNPIDTTDIEFHSFQSTNPDSNFELIAVTPGGTHYVLFLDTNNVYYPEFYNGETRYFYSVARWISLDEYSLPSDTTQGYLFPNDRPRRGYDMDIIEIPIRLQ
jgi:hypothetical protein